MITVLALAVAMLTAAGVHLLLARSLFRKILGFSLLANGANLIVLAAGGEGLSAPLLGRQDGVEGLADPLPQALVLTAIVISMAVTLYLLTLLRATARRQGTTLALRPAGSDAGRDPDEVARELRGGDIGDIGDIGEGGSA